MVEWEKLDKLLEKAMAKRKEYLGDGVYAEHDGYAVVLTTSNGIEQTNRIFLEPEVIRELKKYLSSLEKEGEERENDGR